MMRDGYWLNYGTLKWQTITEHETWIREEKNAMKIGVPPEMFPRFNKYVPHDDRIPFLTWLLKVTPLLRIRGHLQDITFEFSNPEVDAPLKGIAKWCKSCAGEFSVLTIRNFATGGEHQVRWGEFDERKAIAALESARTARERALEDLSWSMEGMKEEYVMKAKMAGVQKSVHPNDTTSVMIVKKGR